MKEMFPSSMSTKSKPVFSLLPTILHKFPLQTSKLCFLFRVLLMLPLLPQLSSYTPLFHPSAHLLQLTLNGFSVELIAALLAKDKLNAFGLMQPLSEDDEQRSVRAYGIYPHASLFNHDCLPNACRFDYVGISAPDDNHNTDIIIRMIHDVP